MERDGEQCVLGDARSHDAARIQSRVRASALTDETVVGSASDFRRGIREDFHELCVSPATLPMYGAMLPAMGSIALFLCFSPCHRTDLNTSCGGERKGSEAVVFVCASLCSCDGAPCLRG